MQTRFIRFVIIACTVALTLTGVACNDSSPTAPNPIPTCTFAVTPASAAVPPGGGTTTVHVNTAASCSWTAHAEVSWIALSPTAGAGPADIVAAVQANDKFELRSGQITIADKNMAIRQEGKTAVTCEFGLDPLSQTFGADGGRGRITVQTNSSCAWTATAVDAWLTHGVVQSARKPRCIACGNCVVACPFGVPELYEDRKIMMKCQCTDEPRDGPGLGGEPLGDQLEHRVVAQAHQRGARECPDRERNHRRPRQEQREDGDAREHPGEDLRPADAVGEPAANRAHRGGQHDEAGRAEARVSGSQTELRTQERGQIDRERDEAAEGEEVERSEEPGDGRSPKHPHHRAHACRTHRSRRIARERREHERPDEKYQARAAKHRLPAVRARHDRPAEHGERLSQRTQAVDASSRRTR